MTKQTFNYMHSEIISRHDDHIELNNQWLHHLNFLLNLHFWDDYENKLVEDEFQSTLCYDV